MSDITRDGPAQEDLQASVERHRSGAGHGPRFTGSTGEYFRIWIVNLVLSLVTLGIYSAWATVRNRRYFYGNTDLDGHRFDFHGDPLAILKGRVLAVIVLLAYAFGTEFHWGITLGAFAIMAVSFPWVLVRALRFRLANTSHRGLRFGFRGTSAQAYRLLVPILLPAGAVFAFYLYTAGTVDLEDADELARHWPTLLLATGLVVVAVLAFLPVLWFRIRRFAMNHTAYGRHRFAAALRLGVFWKAMIIALVLLAVVSGVAIFALTMLALKGAGAQGGESGAPNVLLFMGLTYAVLIPVYLVPFAAWHCITTNHVLSQTRLEDLAFQMRLDPWIYWWLLVSNAFAALLTLGMAIPWAKVRMARYKLSCLTVRGALDRFKAGPRDDPSALGDELGEAFDFDLGF